MAGQQLSLVLSERTHKASERTNEREIKKAKESIDNSDENELRMEGHFHDDSFAVWLPNRRE